MKYAIVCTTIFKPEFVSLYCANIEKYGHKDNVKIYVIPDKKTPEGSAEMIEEYKAKGFNVEYMRLEDQEVYLDRFPDLKEKIPYNTDNRRNIGFLKAYEEGADILISIDDDNFPLEEHDFIKAHSICGKETELGVMESSDGWFNICTLLESTPDVEIYARGFPYRIRRRAEKAEITRGEEKTRIGINAGLWTDDPDIDAVSRNFATFKVSKWTGEEVVLGGKTWSPVNTQNTSLVRELIPAFYYIRMGFDIGGTTIDRFGDIIAGYFCQKIAKTLGYSVKFGSPICDHKRTVHNLFNDLYHEWAGIVLLEDLTKWIEDITLEGNNCRELYVDLAKKLKTQAEKFTGYMWNDQARDFLREITDCMLAWIEAIEAVAE